VNPSSHIWFKKSQYSVPGKYIGEKVDIRYTRTDLFVYYNRELIAHHKLLPGRTRNGKRTDPSHLPYPQFEHTSTDRAVQVAGTMGTNVKTLVLQFLDTAKVKEQALLSINALFKLSGSYPRKDLDEACRKALEAHHYPQVEDVRKMLKTRKKTADTLPSKKNGIVRGADYYRKAGKIDEL